MEKGVFKAKMIVDYEQEILDLYFDKMYSYSEIMKHFKGKYSYAEIKKVINKRYEKYDIEKMGGLWRITGKN